MANDNNLHTDWRRPSRKHGHPADSSNRERFRINKPLPLAIGAKGIMPGIYVPCCFMLVQFNITIYNPCNYIEYTADGQFSGICFPVTLKALVACRFRVPGKFINFYICME